MVHHLAEKVRHKRSCGLSWPKIAKELKIFTPSGEPNPRLAQMIANGYEPKKPETRSRLGLPPICIICYRPIPKPKPPITINQLLSNPIQEMLPDILRFAYEMREEI